MWQKAIEYADFIYDATWLTYNAMSPFKTPALRDPRVQAALYIFTQVGGRDFTTLTLEFATYLLICNHTHTNSSACSPAISPSKSIKSIPL